MVCKIMALYVSGLAFGSSQSHETFMLNFQRSGNLSDSEWAEFDGEIPHLQAFTECHWEKLKFFNMKSHSIWNYCTIMSPNSTMDCLQIWYKRDLLTAGRNIELGIKIGNQIGYVRMKPFLHRTWNFFCWSYDSHSGESKLYLNGKLQGNVIFERGLEINGTTEAYDVSFSLGQEPDAFRGMYDKEQAFRGSISELNLWDYVLDDTQISELAKCMKTVRGNVISWRIGMFKLFNITTTKIQNLKFKRVLLS